MTFHLTCIHIILSLVWVAERSLFGKYLLYRLTICSLCILTICNFSHFSFWFCSDCFSIRSLHTFYFQLQSGSSTLQGSDENFF